METNKYELRKPSGNIHIVYFSTLTENTKTFVEKLGFESSRIPLSQNEDLEIDKDYVLISPTYSGGLDDFKGSVPRQVIKFLNNENNRKHCIAVIGSGNTNFGDTYGLAGYVLSKKLEVPLLHIFELRGTQYDVNLVTKKIKEIWNK